MARRMVKRGFLRGLAPLIAALLVALTAAPANAACRQIDRDTVQPAYESTYALSGRVTTGPTGTDGFGGVHVRTAGGAVSYATDTDSNGDWSIEVPAGIYQIELSDASDPAATGPWVGWLGFPSTADFVSDWFGAQSFTVSTGPVTGLDVALAHVKGAVMNQAGTQPLSGISIAVQPSFFSATTDSSGGYVIVLSTGTYDVLSFVDSTKARPDGYYVSSSPGNWSSGGLDPVPDVTLAGDVTLGTVLVPDGYRLSGVVTNGSRGIGSVYVNAMGCDGACVSEYTTSAADGTFSLTVQAGERFGLEFQDEFGTFVTAYWDGTKLDAGSGSMRIWTVDADVSNIDVAMSLPLSKPLALTASRVESSATSLTLTWDPPAWNGSSTITGYTVWETSPSPTKVCDDVSGTSCTVGGLTPGTNYTFYVYASTTMVDIGPSSDLATGTPSATAPGRPTSLSGVRGPGSGQVTLSWIAPDLGSGTFVSYTVTQVGLGHVGCTVNGPTSCIVSGLTNGTPYAFNIFYTTDDGSGSASDDSSPITPSTVPGAPTSVSATGGYNSAQVSWVGPVDNGGATVTAYAVVASDGEHGCAWTSGPLTCAVTGLANGRTYTFTVAASNVAGAGPASAPSNQVTPAAPPPAVTGSTYHALQPMRLLDTRNGTGGISKPLISHQAQGFQVTGDYVVGGVHVVIPADASAVTGNLTVTGQKSRGFLYIGPIAVNDPTSSTLNFPVLDDRANAVTVALGSGGKLFVTYAAPTSSPTANAIFDVTGYFTRDTTGATYHPLTPTRLLDTRINQGINGALRSHVAQGFQVTGGLVPATATAVTGNLTVTGQTSLGFMYIGPSAANNPTSSTLNFPTGDDRANAVTVALGSGGKLYVTYAAPTSAPTGHAIFDVTGYFTQDASGVYYYSLTPARILDTRDGTGGISGALQSHAGQGFAVWGHGGVLANATAVTGNLTVTGQTSLGFLYVGPKSTNNPTSSNLNFPLGDDRANAVTVALDSNGLLYVTYAAPRTPPTAHAIFDVTGYFAP